jgi:multidrug efflux system membrane fusion protein
MVQITRGLVPGEAVVVDGVDKLRDGAAVEIVSPSVKPAAASAAEPAPAKKTGKRPPEGTAPAKN